jgi:mono/diheme cytochrome c family protein
VFRSACIAALMVLFASSSGAQSPPMAATPKTAAAAPATAIKPVQRADSTPQGKLKNPYSDSDKAIVDSGAKLFSGASCGGCHGGTGGGGICPPLANGVWIYGGDDDTLFRLVTYGTETLQSKGYSRKAFKTSWLRCQPWEVSLAPMMICGGSSPSSVRCTMDQPSVSLAVRHHQKSSDNEVWALTSFAYG